MCRLEKVMNPVKRKEGAFLAEQMSIIFSTIKVLGEADVHKLTFPSVIDSLIFLVRFVF